MSDGPGGVYAGAAEEAGAGAAPPRRLRFDPADPRLQRIDPAELFDGRRLLTQVVVAPLGRTVWISGQIGCGPDNRLVGPDKPSQIAQAFANLRAALAAAGVTPACVVKITEYVADYDPQRDLPLIAREIAALFAVGATPANTLAPVPRLGRDGCLFEVEAHAVSPSADDDC